MKMQKRFVTSKQLSFLMSYDERTIRERLKDRVLLEGKHYFRPFGGRKILYDWFAIERDMKMFSMQAMSIPMANGGVSHG